MFKQNVISSVNRERWEKSHRVTQTLFMSQDWKNWKENFFLRIMKRISDWRNKRKRSQSIRRIWIWEDIKIQIHTINLWWNKPDVQWIESSLSWRTIFSFLDCKKKKVWRDAMQEEISAILRNKTWIVVKLRRDVNPIGVKWVFRVKKDNMGKTRLVVKGYIKKHGIDYNEVFSPIARLESIRILTPIFA